MSSNKVFKYLEKHNNMDTVCNIMLCELLLYTDFNYNDLKKLLKVFFNLFSSIKNIGLKLKLKEHSILIFIFLIPL
jgi:hypothetical protein